MIWNSPVKPTHALTTRANEPSEIFRARLKQAAQAELLGPRTVCGLLGPDATPRGFYPDAAPGARLQLSIPELVLEGIIRPRGLRFKVFVVRDEVEGRVVFDKQYVPLARCCTRSAMHPHGSVNFC